MNDGYTGGGASIGTPGDGRMADVDPTRALREVFSMTVQPILGQTWDFQATGNSFQKMSEARDALNSTFAELGVGADEYKVNIEQTGQDAWRMCVDTTLRKRTQEEMKPIFEASTTGEAIATTDRPRTRNVAGRAASECRRQSNHLPDSRKEASGPTR